MRLNVVLLLLLLPYAGFCQNPIIPAQDGPANLCFVFSGNKEKLLIFDSFSFR
jgi:hypothetical protein